MLCPNCKAQISNEVSFCPNCGGRVEAQVNTKNNPGASGENAALKEENRKLKKQIKLIAIILAILAIVAVALVVVKSVMSDDAKQEDATEPETEVTEPTMNDETVLNGVKVGDYIEFGAYEQDNDSSNGKEPIEWRVLEVEENRALLISEKALDCVEYNEMWEDITWEDCALREWLNNEFINEAFSSSEKSQIPTVKVEAEDNPEYGTEAGNDTEDKVFLLSIDEAEKYFDSDAERMCKPTEYANEKDIFVNEDYESCWLRSPGYGQDYAAYVNADGLVVVLGDYVHRNYSIHFVRPALWVNLE